MIYYTFSKLYGAFFFDARCQRRVCGIAFVLRYLSVALVVKLPVRRVKGYHCYVRSISKEKEQAVYSAHIPFIVWRERKRLCV